VRPPAGPKGTGASEADDSLSQDIATAVAVLRSGGLVAIPTETVYGLGADASNESAVRRIFAVKGRPTDHPLIVHLASADQLDTWAADPSDVARRLADAFWPGPLTLLVPRASGVLDVVTGGRPTVGLRVPAHPLALAVLGEFGGGIAAPSANRFGKVSPTSAAHVCDDLGSDVDFVLDGGPCIVGVESTIVDCTVQPPQILRPGGIGAGAIAAIIDDSVAEAAGPSRASGMLPSHYAPDCAVLLVDTRAAADSAIQRRSGRVEILDLSDDARRAARQLYELLRDADRRGVDLLVIIQPSSDGIGEAVRDRLQKAAAPRQRA
jgi:L-threonylcarbamoyladenylate synthase